MSANPRETILIVDDNDANRLLLKAMLENSGFVTAEATNGKECIEYCEKELPLIVLLDVMMPVMDGIAACEVLRERFSKSELPIIMVTTKISGADVAIGFKAGANDYITKPVDRNILITRVENQIRLLESQQSFTEEKKKAEHALQIQSALGDALVQAIAVHDLEGNIVYVNEPLTCAVRFEECDTISELFSNLFGGLLAEVYEERFHTDATNSESIIDEDLTVTIGSSERFFHIKSRVITLSDAKTIRFWVFEDITAERLVEQRANQQVKMETVGLFAAGVAHNFNNLLGSILGASDILKRSQDKPERFLRCLDIIQDSVASGMRLTKKMSSSRKRKNVADDRVANFGSVFSEVWSEILDECSKTGIGCEFDESLKEVQVGLTPKDLEVVLRNLLQNAVDAISESGEIVCKLADVDTRKTQIAITLKDSGHGMDEQTLERAFEPFFSTRSLDHTNNVSVEGKGLGMWNVYSILRMAKGDVKLQSTPGKGSTATITLPLIEDYTSRSIE